jgi:hypothetical protein
MQQQKQRRAREQCVRQEDQPEASEHGIGPCPHCGINPWTVHGQLAQFDMSTYTTAVDAELQVDIMQAGPEIVGKGCRACQFNVLDPGPGTCSLSLTWSVRRIFYFWEVRTGTACKT